MLTWHRNGDEAAGVVDGICAQVMMLPLICVRFAVSTDSNQTQAKRTSRQSNRINAGS